MKMEYKIFKPRDKEVHCEHWCDCYKNSSWVVEIREDTESYFMFYCDKHLKDFQKEQKSPTNKGDNNA